MYNDDVVLVVTFAAISIAEAHRDLEPFLAWKGSPQPDCLNIAGNQALHIHDAFSVMDAQKLPACLYSF